jgi:predicted amidohydrolase YtcJ
VPAQALFNRTALNSKGRSALQTDTTIFFGGPILTIDDELPLVEAMAIRDGKIIALGDRSTVLRHESARTQMVDLQGCTLMPGFIDPHVHLAWSAFTKYRWVNVAPPIAGSRDEVIATVRAAAEGKRDSEWVIACGYDSSFQSGSQPALTARELDAISINQPIFVLEQSWDVAYVNHKALELAGITDEGPITPAPDYVRDANGRMTGEIRGAISFAALARTFPPITFEQKLHDCKQILRSWAKQGCTTVYDAALGSLWGQDEVRLFLEIACDPTTPIRIRVALVPTDGLPHTAGLKPMQGNDRLYFAGIKFWSDGIAPGVIGAFDQPFMAGVENDRLNYSDVELQTLMQTWHDAGWQLLVHANGSEAVEQTLRIYDRLITNTPRPGHRHRIEHAALISESQLLKARALGLSISHLIGHVYWSNILKDRIRDDHRCVVPLAADFEMGVCVSLHSDSPATPVEPLRYLQSAVTRISRGSGDVSVPSQRISIEQALKTVTIYPAYQCFLDDKVGSLKVGKFADLVVLDHNPCSVDPEQISEIRVLETYLEGAPLSSEVATGG